MCELPPSPTLCKDILLLVFKDLDIFDLCTCMTVCTHWKNTIDTTPTLFWWKYGVVKSVCSEEYDWRTYCSLLDSCSKYIITKRYVDTGRRCGF